VLGRDWEPAQATVVATRILDNWSRTNATPYEYVVDVRPADEAPFRATFHDPLMHGHWNHPAQGDVVNVLFHPKSHEVKLSDEYKISPRKLDTQDDERFRAIADAPPDSPNP
jgi:hypothetical protein